MNSLNCSEPREPKQSLIYFFYFRDFFQRSAVGARRCHGARHVPGTEGRVWPGTMGEMMGFGDKAVTGSGGVRGESEPRVRCLSLPRLGKYPQDVLITVI